MNNYLDSGGVLPSGLLSSDDSIEKMGAFNKTYRNYPLRLGIITNIYPTTDPKNFSKMSTEYDVSVFEQNEDRGNTILTYKNCIASDSFGSIADFLDKNLRQLTQNNNLNGTLNTTNQNGATVLLLCLDAVSEKAVILGALPHPDRPTTLLNSSPYLQGEYNGVNILVNNDGSTSLTFKGATDNYGNPTNPNQGNTVVQIETDGSFQVSHKTVTFTMSKSGEVTLTATGDINITSNGNTTITATGNAIMTCQGTATVNGSQILLGTDAVEAVIKGNTFAELYDNHVHYGNLGLPTSPPLTPMDTSLSKISKTL